MAIQQNPEFWRLSKKLRDFVLTAPMPEEQEAVMRALLSNKVLAEIALKVLEKEAQGKGGK